MNVEGHETPYRTVQRHPVPRSDYYRALVVLSVLIVAGIAFDVIVFLWCDWEGQPPLFFAAGAVLALLLLLVRRLIFVAYDFAGLDDEIQLYEDRLDYVVRGRRHRAPIAEITGVHLIPHDNPAHARFRVALADGRHFQFYGRNYDLEQVQDIHDDLVLDLGERFYRQLRRGQTIEMRLDVPVRDKMIVDIIGVMLLVALALGYVSYQYLTRGEIASSGGPIMISAVGAVLALLIWVVLVRRWRRGGVVLTPRGINLIGAPLEAEVPWSAIEEAELEDYIVHVRCKGDMDDLHVGRAIVNADVLPELAADLQGGG